MIHYHGLPVTQVTAAAKAVSGGHAFVSFAYPEQLAVAIEVAQSFGVDNGAFSAWKSGKAITDWSEYYDFAERCLRIPSCDFAIIPDVIDGGELENDALVNEWPLPKWFGAPVWRLHESLERLESLFQAWPRVCLVSSGEYAVIGTAIWWRRMAQAMRVICDSEGRPKAKIHGLRMLNPRIFTRLPLSSADSTNIARNVGIDAKWKGAYAPANREGRAAIMRSRIEAHNAPPRWGNYSSLEPIMQLLLI